MPGARVATGPLAISRAGTRHGVATSFDAFFEAQYDSVRRALAVAFGHGDLAEECAQEAFARAYRTWSRVSVMDRPDGWVYAVALNHARRTLTRRERAWVSVEDAADDGSAAVDRTVDVGRLLARLPPRQRVAVVLRFLADLSIDEIGAAMHASPGTVKSTLRAALARLGVTITIDEESPYAN